MAGLVSTTERRLSPVDERVGLNYIQWKDDFEIEKPYEIISQAPEGCPQKNFTIGPAPTQVIHDLRGQESRFNLDDNGFEVRKSEMTIHSLGLHNIETCYLPTVKSLLTDVDPGAEVHIFDWRLRSSDNSRKRHESGSRIDLNDPGLVLRPVQIVHNDQSSPAAIKRVHHHLGDKSESLLKRRFRIINVWRPLQYPIENFPLALCDGSSVPPEKLLTVDHVRTSYVGESLYPLYCEDMRWYYLNQQTKDEVLVFKTFDSSPTAKAKCCPHTSFSQSGVRPNTHPRESIEVRALVFSKGAEDI